MNLSKRTLSESEIKVLLKGPKFTPTPRENVKELKSDIYEFCRKLRLCEFFYDSEKVESINVVECKSNFTPDRNRDTILDNYIEFLSEYEFTSNPKRLNNLQKNEWLAIQNLRNDKSIVIKVADKGNCWVIMNSGDYKQSVLELLKDETTYSALPEENVDENVMHIIEQFTKKYQKMLTKQEINYLTKFNHKSSQFYGLPKIHKSGKIKTAIEHQKSQVRISG